MAKRGFNVIDTELHLEEPLDLFDQNLEEPYRSITRVAVYAVDVPHVPEFYYEKDEIYYEPSPPAQKESHDD